MATTNSQQTQQSGPLKRGSCICATDHLDAQLLANDPRYKAQRQSVEQFTRLARTAPTTRTGQAHIPVVVHIVYNGGESSPQKLSDAQVESQIRVLNEDYNATNVDISKLPGVFQPLIGNPNIRFFLATRDPQGQPTSGITRTPTQLAGFNPNKNGPLDERMKHQNQGGADGWPADQVSTTDNCRGIT